jgi:hypothetical protein
VDSIGVQVAILLAVLFLVERLTASRRRGRTTGAGAPIFTWLIATAVTLWSGGLLAFVVVHALLFTVGSAAAAIAAAVSVILLIAAPFVLAIVIRRRARLAARG